jgi:hypothetical protein
MPFRWSHARRTNFTLLTRNIQVRVNVEETHFSFIFHIDIGLRGGSKSRNPAFWA